MIPVRTHTFVVEWDKDPKPLFFCTVCLRCMCVCVCMALPFSAHSVCHDKYICLCFTGWHRLWLAGTAVLAPGPWACVCAQPSDSFHGSLHPRSPHPPSSPLQKSSQAGAATRTPYPLWVLLSGPSLYCPPPLSLDLLSRMRATALHYLLLRLSLFCFTSQRWSEVFPPTMLSFTTLTLTLSSFLPPLVVFFHFPHSFLWIPSLSLEICSLEVGWATDLSPLSSFFSFFLFLSLQA